MHVNNIIFHELIKRGYSVRGKTRVWDISDSRLWYLTPALSKGFLNLKRFNPYRKNVVEREIALIKQHAKMISATMPLAAYNLIDLGSGSGVKAEAFIESLPRTIRLRYCPVDISSYYLGLATSRIRGMKSKKIAAIKPFLSDFKDLHSIAGILRNGTYQRNLVLLLGETLSHYEINDFLFQLSKDMFKGDVLVIGNGIRKGKRLVGLDKYRIPLFNEWFIHVMRGLGFKENEVKYDARFTNNRVEGLYRIGVEKKITYKGKTVAFKEGDEVVVGMQYKYYPKELQKFCKMYFSEVKLITDKTEDYALVICKK